MITVTDQIAVDLNNFKELIRDFLFNYSCIRYCGHIDGLIGFSDYEWCALELGGQQIQARLYKEYSYLTELIGILIFELPPEYHRVFKECKTKVFRYIEQNHQVWDSSTSTVFNKVIISLDKQFDLLNNLYLQGDGGYIFIPDTNALLKNQYMDTWVFDGVTNFEVLLTPSVLSELDQLKITGRNDEVRNKAQSIIRSIKEYRRRGRLTEGVTLKKDISTIRAIAVEPDFKNTFSWLKEDNKDDRLLATLIEVMKRHPNSIVQLVTSDINLQNKAEYSRLPFVEPPSQD